MKELSFFRISFDWTHSSRCFVPYKSLSQKPHYKHVLSDRTRFLMIFSVQYHQAMGLTFSIKFSDKSHAFHGNHLRLLPVRSAYYIKASLRRRFRAVIALELEKYAANSNNRFVAQTVAYVIHQVSPVYSFIHHFLRALSQSKLTPRYVLSSASPAMHPTLTAYAAVILHLPSDLALPFDVKSFPQKDEP